jgi:NhaC family Na+:H+ antiporter
MKKETRLIESIIVLSLIVFITVLSIRSKTGLVLPLFLSWLVLCFFSFYKEMSYTEVQNAALNTIKDGMQSVLILLSVGALIGSWIASGTVPTLIYFGLKIISPKLFLLSAVLFCSILSLATGTSYGSAATGGLAMMGIGIGLGVPTGMTAAAVITGAIFGDKMSPFSDTTNLAPAMAGGDLFKHIYSMLYTTLPAYAIACAIFIGLGVKYGTANYDLSVAQSTIEAIENLFNINFVTFLPMLFVIALLLKKAPSIPTLLAGAVFGAIIAIFIQGSTVTEVLKSMASGYRIESSTPLIQKLLNRGGISSMSEIALVMIFAMGLGGMLQKTNILSTILNLFVKKLNSTPKLIAATLLSGYISGAIGCTQAFSHVITGKLFEPIYREKGIVPEVLSRTSEDSGTLCGVLIPWHTNSIFMVGALGVAYSQYAPYMFFNYITPVVSMFLAFTGYGIWSLNKEKT